MTKSVSGGQHTWYTDYRYKGRKWSKCCILPIKLGVKVTLFTVADDIGCLTLRQSFSRFRDSVNLLITSGRHGRTTAFELPNESGVRVNVMISDVGDNSDFGPDRVNSPEHLNYLKAFRCRGSRQLGAI